MPRIDPKRVKMIVGVAIVGILLGGAATATNSALGGEPGPIGVCHATGSAEQPYVFLIVPEDGYEHGHHRHHETDFFREATDGGCGDDEYVTPYADNETSADDVENETPSDEVAEEPAEDNGTAVADDAAGTNETADEPAGDNTTAAEDEATDGAEGNETADNETEAAPGDASVSQVASQDEHQVVFDIVVSNVGESPLGDVSVGEELPDVRRPWLLSGADASDCTLDGNSLTCWFGELAPGESRTISLSAYLDRMPCGESMTGTAWASALGDPESRNDASSASIAARYC